MAASQRTAAQILSTPTPMGPNQPAWTLKGPKFTPVRKGNSVSITLDANFYNTQVDSCSRFACIGRLIMAKGNTPLKYHDLKTSLQAIWEDTAWHMLAIGHGFFVFQFATEELRNKVLDSGMFKLKLGTVYMQPWVPDFNPSKAATTHAKVWIRLHGLRFEFLHRSIILSLASAFGRPITLDTGSLDRCFGSYVRVLVDVDLSQELDAFIMLETPMGAIRIDMSMEKVPDFCKNCMSIGHLATSCRRSTPRSTSAPEQVTINSIQVLPDVHHNVSSVSPSAHVETRPLTNTAPGILSIQTDTSPTIQTNSQPMQPGGDDSIIDNAGFKAVFPRRDRGLPRRLPPARPSSSIMSKVFAATNNQFTPLTGLEVTNDSVVSQVEAPLVDGHTSDCDSEASLDPGDNSVVHDSIRDSIGLEKERRLLARANMDIAVKHSWADLMEAEE